MEHWKIAALWLFILTLKNAKLSRADIPFNRTSQLADKKCQVGTWLNSVISYAYNDSDIIQPNEFVDAFSVVNLNCAEGYKRRGTPELTCVGDTWSKEIPICQELPKVISLTRQSSGQCEIEHRPDATFLARLDPNVQVDAGEFVDNGTYIKIDCPYGTHKLIGKWNYQCIDGEWSDPIGICNPKSRLVTESRKSPSQCQIGFWPNTRVVFPNTNITIQAGKYVDNSTLVEIICPEGFTRLDYTSNICNNGKWEYPPPACEKYCEAFSEGKFFETKCYYENEVIPCNRLQRPNTRVVLSCRIGYQQNEINSRGSTTVCLENGEWDSLAFACIPVCGSEETYIDHGVIKTNRSSITWNALIYKKVENTSDEEYERQCNGNIISTRIVLSVAQCFWNAEIYEIYDKEDYLVAVGKTNASFYGYESLPTQSFKIQEIVISHKYHGKVGNNEADFSIIILQEDIIYQTHIKPICIDTNRPEIERDLDVGTHGKMAGFRSGYNEKLQIIIMSIDGPFKCTVNYASRFVSITTGDKICAVGGVCYNKGSGLIIPKMINGKIKHYLWGVYSHVAGASPRKNECYEDTVGAFTDIHAYMPLLRSYLLKYT